MNTINWISTWFASQCDGDWEHENQIRIETLDNPGWDIVIDLSGTEFRMLAKLVRVPGHAVSYETLMNATMQSLVTNNTINTHMRNIRKKFEKVDPEFACIKSEYGFGYRWSQQ